jgi:predicted permease
MSAIIQDVRHGLRSLLRTPSFLTAALLTLALGIGSTAAIFSIAYAVLFKPLPYPAADRLFVMASPENPNQVARLSTAQTGEIFFYLRDRVRVLENVAAHGGAIGWNLAAGKQVAHVTGMPVSRGYFDVIGVRPVVGRGFTADEDRPGGQRAVILSDELSRRLFGRIEVVGESIQLGGIPHQVVGVMPSSYWQTPAVDLWTPLRIAPTNNSFNYPVIGRLAANATAAQMAAELDALRWNLQRDVRDLSIERARVMYWMPYQDALGFWQRDQLLLLGGAVGFLLLIACVNVASLQLVRGVSRRREMATRAALGGGRGRLVRQVLTESVLLAVAGAGLGLVAAQLGLDALLSLVPSGLLGGHIVQLEWRVVATVLTLTVGAGVLFGLAPALSGARIDVRTALVESGRHSASRHTMRLRRVFTAAQCALAVMLLVGAGLFIRSFLNLRSVPLGFDPSNVVIGKMSLQGASTQVPGGIGLLFQRAIAELRNAPGVSAVAVANSIPVERGMNFPVRPPAGGVLDRIRSVDLHWISSDYFAAFRIPVRDGRSFDDRDQTSSTPVAIVNETFATSFFGRPQVVGETIQLIGNDPPRQIVGVVRDVKARSGAGWTSGLNALAAPSPPAMYVPVAQMRDTSLSGSGLPMSWIVRTTAGQLAGSAGQDPASMVRRVVQRSAPLLPFLRFEPMHEVIARDLELQRFLMVLVGAFAVAAMTLAIVGIYGLTAYTVGQRTQEVGIRMALGASAALVLRRFLAEGVSVALVGLAAGLAGAALATRLLSSMIFDVAPQDPLTLVVVSLVLIVVAGVSTLIPSIKAARTNPAHVIRTE